MDRNDLLAVTAEMIIAARNNPRGWVEKVTPSSSSVAQPHSSTVVGAWKVDARGEFNGVVILNPGYVFPE